MAVRWRRWRHVIRVELPATAPNERMRKNGWIVSSPSVCLSLSLFLSLFVECDFLDALYWYRISSKYGPSSNVTLNLHYWVAHICILLHALCFWHTTSDVATTAAKRYTPPEPCRRPFRSFPATWQLYWRSQRFMWLLIHVYGCLNRLFFEMSTTRLFRPQRGFAHFWWPYGRGDLWIRLPAVVFCN